MTFLSPLASQGLTGLGSFGAPPVVPVSGQQLPPVAQQAYQQYPILQKLGVQFKSSPNAGDGNMLESWLPGETGTKDQPRPKEFDPGKLGVEIYSDKTRPIDVLGDVVSHHLVNTDPTIKKVYDTFQKSLTPHQNAILQDQYEWAKQNEGEKRSFEDWKDSTGLPAYFRGYAFQQWPQEFNAKAYTPQQIQLFNGMMQYLQRKQ